MGSGSSRSTKPNVIKVIPTEPWQQQQTHQKQLQQQWQQQQQQQVEPHKDQGFQEILVTNFDNEISERNQPSRPTSQAFNSNGNEREESSVNGQSNIQSQGQVTCQINNDNFKDLQTAGTEVPEIHRHESLQEQLKQGPQYEKMNPENKRLLSRHKAHNEYREPEIAQSFSNSIGNEFYSGAWNMPHQQRDRWRQAGHSTQLQLGANQAFQTQQRKRRTNTSLAMQIQNMQDEDVIEFETFYHQNGRTYTCINQGGQRFYMDSFDTQEWQPIPNLWYSQGHFECDGEPIKDTVQADPLVHQPIQLHNHAQPKSMRDIEVSSGVRNSLVDDRAGTIEHPTRGRILTYLFEEKRNIHCYFDGATGEWVKMPLSWEQHTDFVKPLLNQVKDTVPTWKDKYDMIAALRQSNYDVDDAISTYYTVGDTGVMEAPDRLAGYNTKMIKEKDNKISILQTKLAKLSKEHEDMKKRDHKLENENQVMRVQLNSLQEQVTALQVEVKTTNLKVTSLQQERPRTARPVTRMNTKIQVPLPQGPVIDEASLRMVEKQAKELDKAHRGLKNMVKACFDDLKSLLTQAHTAVTQMTNIGSNTNKELENLKVLYKKECLQRKLLYNQVQELRGNIRVFCRVRFDDRTEACQKFPSDQDIECNNAAGKKMSFRFDKVFTPESKQTEVFAEVLPIITSCVDGYNICIMAYGQTGAGKTYTMMGTPEDAGVNIRSIRELLKVCNERTNISYTLKVSMVEVYNEHVQDLLSSHNREALDIRMQGKRLVIKGLTEFEVAKEDDITKVMEIGDKNRSVAATKMNSSSSRSHLLLMLTVEGVNKVSKATSFGSLTLVDLAGSERISKTEATGQRLVEAAAINKSLTSLGQVFSGLRSNALHIPYRNSKLTHLLQPSLGGDAKACIFVNVSPDARNISETISTLQFGANAKQVQLGKATQNIKGP